MLINDEYNPKYCWAWNRVYVKSNGRIPCWCDTGETHTILSKSLEDNDFILDIVNSKEMREMRLKILQDNEYYIKECKTCCCMIDIDKGRHSRFVNNKVAVEEIEAKRDTALRLLTKEANKNKPLGSISRIQEIQVEPSFPCNLRCPGCLQGRVENPLSTEEKPYILPLEWFKNIIASSINNDVKIGRIAFVGRGEPTLNKELGEMIKYARKMYDDDIIMSMDTNSTQEFKEEYTLLNWINCSIDGSNQESYSKYRIGGEFNKTIDFMQKAMKFISANGNQCNVRWKYILFDTNDTIAEMNKAQEIAKSIGIGELFFVITHAGGATIKPSPTFTSRESVQNYIDNNKIFNNTKVLYAT